MASQEKEKVVFAWWNTSLAPSATSRSTEDDRLVACAMIKHLVETSEADFIALGEVSEQDLEFLVENCKITGYIFASGIKKAGKSSFDICYLYKSNKIVILNSKSVAVEHGGSTLKIAQKVDVLVDGSSELFHLFISHWPSRLWCAENDADRHLLGVRLRDSIELVLKEDKPPFVILLGDYNDEPFDVSLSRQVMASRDADLVRRRKHLFYNPFWNYLCKKQSENPFAGSYFYKSGKITRWHTFDQIIFSHAFVKGTEWVVAANCEHVVHVPSYTELVKNPAHIFDHLPVYGIIERVA